MLVLNFIENFSRMAEVKHEVKSVKNQGEVIVDNDRAAPRERNPELDQFRVSARCFTAEKLTVELCIRPFIF